MLYVIIIVAVVMAIIFEIIFLKSTGTKPKKIDAILLTTCITAATCLTAIILYQVSNPKLNCVKTYVKAVRYNIKTKHELYYCTGKSYCIKKLDSDNNTKVIIVNPYSDDRINQLKEYYPDMHNCNSYDGSNQFCLGDIPEIKKQLPDHENVYIEGMTGTVNIKYLNQSSNKAYYIDSYEGTGTVYTKEPTLAEQLFNFNISFICISGSCKHIITIYLPRGSVYLQTYSKTEE